MGTRETAIAGQAARETGTTSAATATVHRPPTYLCEAAGDEPALYCFQGNYLAGRHRPEIAVPICSSSRACRSSGLREGGTSRGGVVTESNGRAVKLNPLSIGCRRCQ